MKSNETISENVILIDVSYLNYVVADVKRNFEQMLHRPLKNIDVSDLLVYFALDGGIRGVDNTVQVVFVYDGEQQELAFVYPSKLETELNNVAFDDDLGSFILSAFEAKSIITRENLFFEFFETLADAEALKRLIFIVDEGLDAEMIALADKVAASKELVQFRMQKPLAQLPYNWEVLAYPIMQALGIKGSELN